MLCKVEPGRVSGEVFIPPSKSETMRALIFAAMADGVSTVENILKSPDTYAMIEGIKQFGVKVVDHGSLLEIQGLAGKLKEPKEVIDVGNSGLALRFLLALGALSPGVTKITGDESIRTRRPVKPLLDVYKQNGMHVTSFKESKNGVLSVKGMLQPGSMMIAGEDSQPVSSLLFSTSFLKKPSEIYVLNAGERPWVDLTLDWLDSVGASVENEGHRLFEVAGGLSYGGISITVGGDYSSALFPIAAALITGGRMRVHGLSPSSKQPDVKALDVFRQMGASISFDEEGVIEAHCESGLKGVNVDVNDCIDIVPVLSAMAVYASSPTVIKGAEIARAKESDRVAVMVKQLSKMGAKIEEKKDGMVVHPSTLHGSELYGEKDHRIVMAHLCAAAGATSSSAIHGAEVVAKTYPTVMYDFMKCGLNIEILEEELCRI